MLKRIVPALMDRIWRPTRVVVAARDAKRLILKPSGAAVARFAIMFGFATIALAVAAVAIGRWESAETQRTTAWLVLLPACLTGLGALWYLRQGSLCLVLEINGQIKHGRRRLCSARDVASIEVQRKRNLPDEPDAYDLYFGMNDGRLVELPAYFTNLSTQEEADELAEELSSFLGVDCVNHRSAQS